MNTFFFFFLKVTDTDLIISAGVSAENTPLNTSGRMWKKTTLSVKYEREKKKKI